MMPRARNRKHEAMPSLVENELLSLLTSSGAQAFIGEAHRLQGMCLNIGCKRKEMA
jgi:hypothetical protein